MIHGFLKKAISLFLSLPVLIILEFFIILTVLYHFLKLQICVFFFRSNCLCIFLHCTWCAYHYYCSSCNLVTFYQRNIQTRDCHFSYAFVVTVWLCHVFSLTAYLQSTIDFEVSKNLYVLFCSVCSSAALSLKLFKSSIPGPVFLSIYLVEFCSERARELSSTWFVILILCLVQQPMF